MGEPDSWEDMEEGGAAAAPKPAAPAAAPHPKLNANAPSFTFNPSAATFTPSFAPAVAVQHHHAPLAAVPAASATAAMTPAVVPQEAMHLDEGLVQRGGNAALDPPVQAGFVSGAAALAALAGVDSESGADRSNGVPESDDSVSEQATSTDEKTHAVEEVEKVDAIDAPAEKSEATPNGEPDGMCCCLACLRVALMSIACAI
jgi:hypothetical protein